MFVFKNLLLALALSGVAQAQTGVTFSVGSNPWNNNLQWNVGVQNGAYPGYNYPGYNNPGYNSYPVYTSPGYSVPVYNVPVAVPNYNYQVIRPAYPVYNNYPVYAPYARHHHHCR